jgi:TolB-like protein
MRNSEKPSKEIARALAADFLIEGSIRKSGNKIRLAVQLVEAASDTQIWGKQYDAELVDILDLEQKLSATIASTISGRIGHRIQQSAVRKPANCLKSYDYLLRGLYHMGKFTAADMEVAQQQIEKCIALDPDNAEAHTQLGMVHTILRLENWTSDRQQTLESEGKHLTRALELAPDNALVHAYYAEHLLSKRDYDLSEFHVNKAIELNPTAAEGYTVKADLMGFTRRYEEALNLADQCFRLDPNGVGTGWVAGDVYRITGQYEKAIRTLRSISHPPATIHALIAASFVGLGQLDKAKTEMALFLKRARKEMPNMPESRVGWRKLYKESSQYKYEEDYEELFSQLLQAGLCDDTEVANDEIPSIAVLPFENMSGDPEQAFFSDGITTDIVATLSKFQHMRVISRHSTLQYKNREASITDIASEQSVRYILEGSVRKSGGKIRVNAELIDAHSEQNIWSERYDRDLDDVFTVQDEVTRNIAVALKVKLTDGERSATRTAGTRNLKAWELVLLATDLQDSYIQQNVLDSRTMIQQAIELDPNYAYARVALGWTHWQEAYSDWTDSFEQSMLHAAAAVEQSLQIEPDNAEAWILASTINITNHQPDKLITACNRALELEPGNAEVQALAGFAMNFNWRL